VGCVLVIKQARQASKSETELKNGIQGLAVQSAEVSRLQTSNNELQQQVLDLAKLNATLTRENISTVTGGDSFCWMGVNFQFGHPTPIFTHSGKYTLYEVHVRISDLNKFRQKIERKEPFTLADDISIDLHEMAPATSGLSESFVLPFSDESAQDFNVFFSARNGRWTELLRLRKVHGHWSSAVQVAWQYRIDRPVTQEPIFEQIDDDYPRNNRRLVDWN
jgi:hypothetical protein